MNDAAGRVAQQANLIHSGIVLIGILGLLVVATTAAQTADSKSLDEVNKEPSNPISSIWALQLRENTYWLNKPDRNVVNMQFQPVLPLALTDDWNLITRPVFQVMNSTPYVNERSHLHRVTGFGDTILATLLSPSPKLAGPWLLGAGSSFIFPTATNSRLGQNKWQLDRPVCWAIWVTNGWREYFRNSGFQLVARVRRR
jgi:hypothetical protein